MPNGAGTCGSSPSICFLRGKKKSLFLVILRNSSVFQRSWKLFGGVHVKRFRGKTLRSIL